MNYIAERFEVRIRKQIHACFAAASSTDVIVERTIILPFPPYAGLSLHDGNTDASWEATLVEVHFDISSGVFDAWDDPDTELYEKGREELRNRIADRTSPVRENAAAMRIAEERYVSRGWKVVPR